MNLRSLRASGHTPTLLSAFLHFDVSFMVWVILGALAPFITTDPALTGVNLRVEPLAPVQRAGQFTIVIKPAEASAGQPSRSYNLLIKPGTPSSATRASVKPVEKFLIDNADPASIARVNKTSKLIRLSVAPTASGNPNENVVPLRPSAITPIANGYPASTKLTLVAIPLLAAGFWRILVGFLVDRLGAKRVGLASLTLTLLPLFLAWEGRATYASLVLVGVFLGLAGASFAVALPIVSRWYPPELQGVTMGIAGAGNSGTVVATIFAPLLARSFGWHAVFGLLMVPVGLTLAAFAFLAKEPPRKSPPATATDFSAVLKRVDLWRFCALYFVTFGGFVGLSTFFNTFFVDQFDAPKAAVGLWTWPFIVAGSFLRPVGGALSDRFGGIRVLSALYGLVIAASCAVAVLLHSFPATCCLLFAVMGALGMGNGSVFQLVPQRFGREIGIVTGIVGAAGGVGGYYLNFALGHLHDMTGTYASGFAAMAAIALVSLLILRRASQFWGIEDRVRSDPRTPALAGAEA